MLCSQSGDSAIRVWTAPDLQRIRYSRYDYIKQIVRVLVYYYSYLQVRIHASILVLVYYYKYLWTRVNLEKCKYVLIKSGRRMKHLFYHKEIYLFIYYWYTYCFSQVRRF